MALEQQLTLKVVVDGEVKILKVSHDLDDVGAAAKRTGASVSAGFSGLPTAISWIASFTASLLAAGVVAETLRRAIGNADHIRDLAAQLKTVTGSADEGAAALRFFNQAAQDTRQTGEDLAKVYADLLPNAIKRGFSPGAFQGIVVQLSQAATAIGKSFDEVSSDFASILSGTPRASNTLLRALGLSPEEVKAGTAGAAELMEGIRRLAAEGATMGDTFGSAARKISDSLFSAFADGFNAARGAVDTGISGMVKAFRDPQLLGAIRSIGETVAKIAPIVAGTVEVVTGALKALLSAAQLTIGGLAAAVGGLLEKISFGAVGGGLKTFGLDLISGTLAQVKDGFTGVVPAAAAAGGAVDSAGVSFDVAGDKIKKAGDQADEAVKLFMRIKGEAEAIAGSSISLARETAVLERAFEALSDPLRGLSQIDIATALAPQLKKVEEEAGNLGLSIYSLGPIAVEAARVVGTGLDVAGRQAREFAASIDKMIADTKRELAGLQGGDMFFGAADQIGALAKSIPLVLSPEAMEDARRIAKESADVQLKALIDGGKAVEKSIQDGAEAFKRNANELSGAMADVFTSLAVDGGRNFGDLASKMFIDGVRTGSKKLTDILAGAVLTAFGAGQVDAEKFKLPGGGFDQAGFNAANAANDAQAQRITQAFTAAVGGISQALEMFRNAAKGQQTSVAGAVISQASIGATIGATFGGWLGAVIGAVVGALIGGILAAVANAKAKKALPFAAYGIEGGEAFVEPFPGAGANFTNITAKQRADMLRRMEQALLETSSAYIKILLKFPTEIFAALPSFEAAMNFKPSQLGDTDSFKYLKNFQEDFELWVTDTLPKAVAEAFKAPVQAAFAAMGVTTERFTEVWTRLRGLDPKEALSVLSDFTDAVIGFAEAFSKMQSILAATAARGRNLSGLNLTTEGEQRAPGVNDFMQSLKESEHGIADLALAFAALPFDEQVKQANLMGAALTQVLDGLIQYLNEIAQIEKSILQDVASRKLEVNLQQAGGDKNLQSEILRQEYERIVQQLAHAAELGLNPAAVEDLYRRAADIANRAFQLDPTKEAAAIYFKQLDFLAALAQQQLQAMANQAQNEVDKLLAMVKPFADYLLGLPVDFAPAFDALKTSLVDFSAALDLLAERIASDALAGPEPWNGPHPNDPNNPNNPGNPHFPGDEVFVSPGASQTTFELSAEDREVLQRIARAVERDDAVRGELLVVTEDGREVEQVPLYSDGGFRGRTGRGRMNAS